MYKFDSRVRYSEVNSNGYLTIDALINYFQDCSTFQSEDAGIGIEYLAKENLAWVVNFWQVDIKRMPKLADEIVIGTMPYMLKGFMGYRNFFMDTKEGERLVVANSIWSLIDMKRALPSRITDIIHEGYELDEKLPMEYLDRKISFPQDGYTKTKEDVIIKQFHLDTNKHVNNGQYIKIALEGLDIADENVKRLRAEYKMQAHIGDVLKPVCNHRTEDNKQQYTISLDDTKDKPYCMVQVDF